MKKVLLFVFAMALQQTGLMAQDVKFNESGCYEVKKVVNVDSVSARALYARALEALSDWAGSQKKSKVGIDVQDKDEGIVIYKGEYYLGYGKQNFMYGWETFINFTLKIRCKVGKAQIGITVPSLTYYWTADNTMTSAPINELLPEYHHKSKFLIKKASIALAPQVPGVCDEIVNGIAARMTKVKSDDDF